MENTFSGAYDNITITDGRRSRRGSAQIVDFDFFAAGQFQDVQLAIKAWSKNRISGNNRRSIDPTIGEISPSGGSGGAVDGMHAVVAATHHG